MPQKTCARILSLWLLLGACGATADVLPPPTPTARSASPSFAAPASTEIVLGLGFAVLLGGLALAFFWHQRAHVDGVHRA
jgi:hypothetical protein